jgi:membrane-associated phospholipid phosphatase
MSMPDSSWQSIGALDSALCIRINRISRFRPACALFRAFSRLGDGVLWYALMAGLLLSQGAPAWPVVLRMAAAGVVGAYLYKVLKRRTSRPRPYRVVPAVVAAALPLDEFSFPSGHTLHATSFTLIATASYPELARCCGRPPPSSRRRAPFSGSTIPATWWPARPSAPRSPACCLRSSTHPTARPGVRVPPASVAGAPPAAARKENP